MGKAARAIFPQKKILLTASDVACTYAENIKNKDKFLNRHLRIEVSDKALAIFKENEKRSLAKFDTKKITSAKPHYTEYPDLVVSDDSERTICKSCRKEFPHSEICPLCAMVTVKEGADKVFRFGFKFSAQMERDKFIETVLKVINL